MMAFKQEPGSDQRGFLALAITDALIDLLVAKNIVTKDEALGMLHDLAKKLAQDKSKKISQDCAQLITNAIPQQIVN